jgi:hypothetical protein
MLLQDVVSTPGAVFLYTYTGLSKSLCAPDDYKTIPTHLMIWRWQSQNTFVMWTVLYWTRSSRTQLGMSINLWRLVGDTLNITRNFLYCNHQVHKYFLITLYNRGVNESPAAVNYRVSTYAVWSVWGLKKYLSMGCVLCEVRAKAEEIFECRAYKAT